MNNADFIKQLDLHYNDIVKVEKGGEIIPKIVGIDVESRNDEQSEVQFIERCPECGAKLIQNEGEAAWYCPNSSGCPPQIKGRIEHFISRKAMNIESLGEGKVQVLFDNNLIKNYADLYDLTYEKMFGLENVVVINDDFNLQDSPKTRKVSFKEKTVNNILKSLQKSKEVPFARVLFALGIKEVGEVTAKILANTFGDIDAIASASVEELQEVNTVGVTIAESIRNFFDKPENIIIIERLKKAGLQFNNEKKAVSESQALAGKSIVVSGVFSSFSRDEIKQLIEYHGGKNSSSISSKTDFLLAGEKMGPEKKKKAEALNVKIINEDEFLKMIEEPREKKATPVQGRLF